MRNKWLECALPLNDAFRTRLEKLVPIFDRGGFVYLITCIAQGPDYGKQYVGLTTVSIESREYDHIISAKIKKVCGAQLQQAILRYQPFEKYFRTERIGYATNWGDLRVMERAAIQKHDTHISAGKGFNTSWGGEGISPLKRLLTRIQNQIMRLGSDLEAGSTSSVNDIEAQYFRRWNSLTKNEKNELLQEDALKTIFLNMFKGDTNHEIIRIAMQTTDSAVVAAVNDFLQQRPELAPILLTPPPQ